MGASVVSGCDASPVLEASEHALDGVAAAIEGGREAGLPTSIALWRDVGGGSGGFDTPPEAVAVIALVAVQKTDGGHSVQQRLGGDAIRDVAAGQVEGDGTAVQVYEGVDFGGASAARTADGLGALPPLPPDALRCAFTAVLSMSNSAGGPPAAASV